MSYHNCAQRNHRVHESRFIRADLVISTVSIHFRWNKPILTPISISRNTPLNASYLLPAIILVPGVDDSTRHTHRKELILRDREGVLDSNSNLHRKVIEISGHAAEGHQAGQYMKVRRYVSVARDILPTTLERGER